MVPSDLRPYISSNSDVKSLRRSTLLDCIIGDPHKCDQYADNAPKYINQYPFMAPPIAICKVDKCGC